VPPPNGADSEDSIHNGQHHRRSRHRTGGRTRHRDRLPHHDFGARHAQIRVFDRSDEPDSDDASDMYVIEVFGVSVLIRLRASRAAATSPSCTCTSTTKAAHRPIVTRRAG
jgi:hypothetical protein